MDADPLEEDHPAEEAEDHLAVEEVDLVDVVAEEEEVVVECLMKDHQPKLSVSIFKFTKLSSNIVLIYPFS